MAAGIFDMHCHLGFYENPGEAATELSRLGVSGVCATVTPDEYVMLSNKYQVTGAFRLGVGLHPWWLADGRCTEADVRQAAEIAAECTHIAEIGLDFSHGRDACARTQVEALDILLDACAASRHVLSLHAVASATALLDALVHGARDAKKARIIFRRCGQKRAFALKYAPQEDEL